MSVVPPPGAMRRPAVDCPTPKKRGWPTAAEADAALAWIRQHPSTFVIPTHSYPCPCGQHHLTRVGDMRG